MSTLPSPQQSITLKPLKRKEVITYDQNERQQKTSQNQYHQRLRIPDCRKERTGQVVNLTTEIASIQKAIEEQKNTLKEKKTALKKAEKEVASLGSEEGKGRC